MNGFLNLAKPAGCTSRDVVDRVQQLARPAKVGHAGTLDPLAEGVLVVCVGQATRLVQYLHECRKEYAATFLLGRASPTEDLTGPVTLEDPPHVPALAELFAAADRLHGVILQRPPAYSALKVGGRRAYELARAGHDVELQPRPVTIFRLHIARYEWPTLECEIECSSGTYVRSLGRDLAERAGTQAVMSALVRTSVGPFRVADALAPELLTPQTWQSHLQPLLAAVCEWPRRVVTPAEIEELRHGRPIDAGPAPLAAHADAPPARRAAVDESGALVALLVPRTGGQLGPSHWFGG